MLETCLKVKDSSLSFVSLQLRDFLLIAVIDYYIFLLYTQILHFLLGDFQRFALNCLNITSMGELFYIKVMQSAIVLTLCLTMSALKAQTNVLNIV